MMAHIDIRIVALPILVCLGLVAFTNGDAPDSSACQAFCRSKNSGLLVFVKCVETRCRSMYRQRVSRFGKRSILFPLHAEPWPVNSGLLAKLHTGLLSGVNQAPRTSALSESGLASKLSQRQFIGGE